MSSNQYFGELSKRYAEPLIQDLTLVPDQLAQNSPSLLAAGWRLWAVACLLRTSGDISRANEWFNAALNLDIKDRELLFKAELIAEGGLGLYEAGHIGESIGILESAESRWREIGALAVGESTEDGGAKAARAFCPFLLDFVAVFDGQLPVSKRRLAGPAA